VRVGLGGGVGLGKVLGTESSCMRMWRCGSTGSERDMECDDCLSGAIWDGVLV
jgi:hypothetical protein